MRIQSARVKIQNSVAAVAVTYLRRFYARFPLANTDARLLAPACVYLAAKAEESQLQAKLLLHFVRKTQAETPGVLRVRRVLCAVCRVCVRECDHP